MEKHEFARLREQYAGVMGRLTEPPPTRIPSTPGARDFGDVYAVIAAGWGDDASYTYPPEGKGCHIDTFGGRWLIDQGPSDEAVMRPIVEEAMAREGINPRPEHPLIKRIRLKGRPSDGE